MKIYQIHEYGGELEDYRDYVVGSYLLYEKANAEKERLEHEEEQLRKCGSCPLYFCPDNCNYDCEDCLDYRVEKAKEYCDMYEYSEDKDRCTNRCFRFYDINYRIEEVEVIE